TMRRAMCGPSQVAAGWGPPPLQRRTRWDTTLRGCRHRRQPVVMDGGRPRHSTSHPSVDPADGHRCGVQWPSDGVPPQVSLDPGVHGSFFNLITQVRGEAEGYLASIPLSSRTLCWLADQI